MATIQSGNAGPLVAPVGELSYNGYPFPVEHHVRIHSRHVYDRAERAVIYTVHRLIVSTTIAEYVGGNSTEDQLLSNLRTLLSTPGKSLILTGHGFSDLYVNVPAKDLPPNTTSISDVAWGPKPRIVTWESLGPHAADITWECEVAIPEATDKSSGQIMAYNYSAAFSVDRQGYTTRTISGYIEIPMTRVNGKTTLPDMVDIYFEAVWPKIPFGFRRTANQRTISEDKRTLSFTITDEELCRQNYLPAGVVECQASHTVENVSRAFTVYQNVISASYTLAPRANKIDSFAYFLQLVALRWNLQLAAAKSANTKIYAYPHKLMMGEPDIYGRSAGTFKLIYLYIQGLPSSSTSVSTSDKAPPPSFLQLQNSISCSGLFTSVGTDYQRWSQSMTQQQVMTPRGNAQLGLGKLDDGIVSLADGDNIITPGSGPSSFRGTTGRAIAQALQVQVPPPETSYIYYVQTPQIVSEPNIIQSFICPTDAGQIFSPPSPASVNATKASISAVAGKASAASSLFQYHAAPGCKVRVKGRALRIGYQIPPPTITKLGGAPVVALGGPFKCWITANCGVPLYAAEWDLLYAATAITDKDMSDLANPYLQTNLGNAGTL